MAVVERPQIYAGTRIPSPVPTILDVPPELRLSDDILEGGLTAALKLAGER